MNINQNQNLYSQLIIVVSLFLVTQLVNAANYDVNGDPWRQKLNSPVGLFQLDDDKFGFLKVNEQMQKKYIAINSLIKKNKFSEAKKKVSMFIDQNPSESMIYIFNALLQLIDKNTAGAKQSFQSAIARDGRNVAAYIGLAKIALDNKEYEQAKQYANTAIKYSPNLVDAYKIVASVALQKDGIDAAEKILLAGLEQVKGNIDSEIKFLKLLGKVYLKKRQMEKFSKLAIDLTKRHEGDLTALEYLMSVQLMNQNFVGAERNLRQLIKKQPDNGKYQFLLARLLSKNPNHDIEVIELLDNLVKESKDNKLVLAFKATFLIKIKKYQQALEIANKLDQDYVDNSLGKVLKGDVYLAQKKYLEAFNNYHLAYKMTSNIQVLDSMLKILTVQGKQKEVIEFLQQELTQDKDNKVFQLKLAGAYQDMEGYAKAIEYYEMFLKEFPENVAVLNNLAWAYSQEGNQIRALELAKKAYRKEPGSAVVLDTYGYILLNSNDKKESLKMLELAAKLAPNNTETLLHLAKSYILNQNIIKAKEILNKIINSDGNGKKPASELLNQL